MNRPCLLALLFCLACGGTQTATTTAEPAPAAEAACSPHLTAWSPGAPYEVYFDLETMKGSPWRSHYSHFTGSGFGVHWARVDADELAFSFRSENDFVAVLRPTDGGATGLATHELTEGVWSNQEVDGQRAEQCASDFEGITLWVHTEGAAMVEASRMMRGRYGFHPKDLTMTLAEENGALLFSLQSHVRPTDESAQQQNLAKAEREIRETFDELFGDGPLELDLQLGTDEWRGTVTATDEAGVTQLMKGALAFTQFGREEVTAAQSAELLCNDSADAYASGGQSALMTAWGEASWHESAVGLLCALRGSSTESQPVLIRAFARRNGVEECRFAELLAESQERLEVPHELCD